jgi:hypothetical protein
MFQRHIYKSMSRNLSARALGTASYREIYRSDKHVLPQDIPHAKLSLQAAVHLEDSVAPMAAK